MKPPASSRPPDAPDLDHDLWVREMCDLCISGMLQCLEPDMRLAYLLREIAELDYDDVALSWRSSRTPRVRWCRGRAAS